MNVETIMADTCADSEVATLHFSPLAAWHVLLNQLLDKRIIRADDWHQLGTQTQHHFLNAGSENDLLARLTEAKLLTPFQAEHIRTEGLSGLILGNYRILEAIGSGGMGIVYRGEHLLLQRSVAIKVLRMPADAEEILLERFFVEMRALARIHHPNIVWALDAGTVKPTRPHELAWHYLVMELVRGTDLETLAGKNPLSVAQACELTYQMASALEETHKLNLIHRDIKPSNILVTPSGQAKLLDFGLALHFGRRRLTVPGTVLGTLSYMAPEQVGDAAGVDIRADIFGLGATLFYCLTGACPFPAHGTITHQAASRMAQSFPDLRKYRQDVGPELEAVVCRMMAHRREDRYPTPQSVMRALLPFVNASRRPPAQGGSDAGMSAFAIDQGRALDPTASPRILIVDDEPDVRRVCRTYLERERFQCEEAADGDEALRRLGERAFDVVVLDIDMPRLSGAETLTRLRTSFSCGNLKVIMVSGGVSPDEMSTMLSLGANDYLAKPLTRAQFVTRTKAALAHKSILDRSDWLNQRLQQMNAELEQALATRSSDLTQVRKTLLSAFARIVASRTQENTGHLARMRYYATAIAVQARSIPHLRANVDDAFVEMLEICAPLHDIGNVAMPDHILKRNGPLDPEDRIVMQAHTTIGAETLASVAKKDRTAAAFWQMAIDISRHHHERFDGTGYPDRLAGRVIPLAARIVAIADAYDALRTPGDLGVALSHNAAVEIIVNGSQGRFDPWLVKVFELVAPEFDEIFRANPEEAPRELE